MEERLSVLKESQQTLENKISSLQETNKKKCEEAEKIRELIAECRNNLNRIKCEAETKRQNRQSPSNRRNNSSCDEKEINGGGQLEPCGKFSSSRRFSGSPCGGFRSPCAQFKDPCGDNMNVSTDSCESRTDALRNQISVLANARVQSRRCIEQLEEKMDKEAKMKMAQNVAEDCSKYDTSDCDGDGLKHVERISCRTDLDQMKVNIRGPPKKLDAAQPINLFDKFQCQEQIISKGDNKCQDDQEVKIFYFTHPGNLVFMFGVAMIIFLLKANLCSLKRGQKTKLILNMLYLGSFGFHYGIVLWMTLIRGISLSFGLSQETFNAVDNLILPKYFSLCILLSAIKFYSFLVNHCVTPSAPWPLPVLAQILIETTSFLMEILSISYIVPAIARLREATDEYPKEDDHCSPSQSHNKNVAKLAKLNRMITIINVLSVMFMGSNLYYISSKLNFG